MSKPMKPIDKFKEVIATRFNPPFYAQQTIYGWRIYFHLGAPHIGEGKTQYLAWKDAAYNVEEANKRNDENRELKEGQSPMDDLYLGKAYLHAKSGKVCIETDTPDEEHNCDAMGCATVGGHIIQWLEPAHES